MQVRLDVTILMCAVNYNSHHRSKIKYFKLPALAEQMQAYINDIERRAELILNGCEGHKIRFGADYVVAAKLTSK